MSVNVSVSISFQVAGASDAQAAIDALNAPDGASVTASVTEIIASGVMTDGELKSQDEITAQRAEEFAATQAVDTPTEPPTG